ncbi:MAG: Tat pathway signal sequence domain protein [Opitutus sp.]
MTFQIRLVCLVVSTACFLVSSAAFAADRQASGTSVSLNWLDGAPPASLQSVTWGVPWPKGKVSATDSLVLKAADGRSVPVQSWPLARWPDGSVKWSGHAISADSSVKGPLTLRSGPSVGVTAAVTVTETTDSIEIDTGGLRCRINRTGMNLFESLSIGERVVARNGRLIASLEDRAHFESDGILREEPLGSRVDRVSVEQTGPIRAVVKLEGVHAFKGSNRELLPFTVRLYFYAGTAPVRLVHSFVFDGDGNKDFIKSLGVAFTVPFKEELHNRHLRFVGDGEGVWAQPVRMLPGYRPQAGAEIATLYPAHLAGERVPDLAALTAQARNALLTVPVWSDAKLTQLGPNNFTISKRTAAASASWLHVTDGHRAHGFAVMGDVSGGIAVGLKHFWQKNPASIELLGGAKEAGEVRVWLWSPDAPAMDLRRYDDAPHGLSVNYEDWKPGWGEAHGIANTSDLTLWAFGAIPTDAQLAAMARESEETPQLVCAPEYYHQLQVFGRWSLPDHSTPALDWLEHQVQGLVDYYKGQVDERSWYGFWDFGDIMHNYDFGRHEWRYDVGGWAWVNTELMPDMLLWYSFLRTGRADLYRFAEAMTRHTSEVDVFHVGPFAPLGSRHNVNHWGDGAKQPRVSHAGLKQFYYFLAADERVGDLLHEQVDADRTYEVTKPFNGSHYVPTAESGVRLDGKLEAARPTAFAARSTSPRAVISQFDLEWLCYAMNWTVEWQRTGNTAWRDLVVADMKAMAADSKGGKFTGGRYFDMIFGGPENMFEMQPMYDVPDFWRAWADTCEFIGREVTGSQMTAPRMLAYAAYAKQSPELGRLAWQKLIGEKLPPRAQPKVVRGPNLLRPVTDPAFLGEPVGWQLHGVASIQWALNAIETAELAKPWLPLWEGKQ